MCVYDLTNDKSFENLENYWLKVRCQRCIRRNIQLRFVPLKEIKTHAPSNAVLLLVGNKADLEAERRVDFERVERCGRSTES